MLSIFEDFIHQLKDEYVDVEIQKDKECADKVYITTTCQEYSVKLIDCNVFETAGYYKYLINADLSDFCDSWFLALGITVPNVKNRIFIILNMYDLDGFIQSDYWGNGINLFTDDFSVIINKTKIGYTSINYRLKDIKFVFNKILAK